MSVDSSLAALVEKVLQVVAQTRTGKRRIKAALNAKNVNASGLRFIRCADAIRSLKTGNPLPPDEGDTEVERPIKYLNSSSNVTHALSPESKRDRQRKFTEEFVLVWTADDGPTVKITYSGSFDTFLYIKDKNGAIVLKTDELTGSKSQLIFNITKYEQPLTVVASSYVKFAIGQFNIKVSAIGFDAGALDSATFNISNTYPNWTLADTQQPATLFSAPGDGYAYALAKLKVSDSTPTASSTAGKFRLSFSAAEPIGSDVAYAVVGNLIRPVARNEYQPAAVFTSENRADFVVPISTEGLDVFVAIRVKTALNSLGVVSFSGGRTPFNMQMNGEPPQLAAWRNEEITPENEQRWLSPTALTGLIFNTRPPWKNLDRDGVLIPADVLQITPESSLSDLGAVAYVRGVHYSVVDMNFGTEMEYLLRRGVHDPYIDYESQLGFTSPRHPTYAE